MAPTRRTRPTLAVKNSSTEASSIRPAAYLRVSTEDQADSGLGLSAQQAKILAMATMRSWPEPQLFIDAGVSGTKASRPQFDLLKNAIREGQVSMLIVASLDRIGRKTKIILDLVELCTAHSCALISIKESFDTSTPTGQFALTLFAGLAQMERDTIALRTIEALDQRGEQYDYKSGMLPFGYARVLTIGGEEIVIDEDRARVVRSILDQARRGKSSRQIAKSLNRQGVPARRGGIWHHSAVEVILKHKDTYRGAHERYPALL